MSRHRLVAVVTILMTLLGTAGVGASRAPAATTAFVRVNRVGYDMSAPKHAYLISHAQESGAKFTVLSAGGAVLSGTVGASLGSWSVRFPYVYALDFDAVKAPGTYTISIGGRKPGSSPRFSIGPAQALYDGPLANGLSFYEDERDGPAFIPTSLRCQPAA